MDRAFNELSSDVLIFKVVTYKADADIVFVKRILMLQLNETHFIVI